MRAPRLSTVEALISGAPGLMKALRHRESGYPVAAIDDAMTSSLPPTRNSRPLRLTVFVSLAMVLAMVAGCARNPTVGSVSVAPILPGEARLWFYRVYLPSETLNMTKVTMNGVYAGYAQLGGAFYRDCSAWDPSHRSRELRQGFQSVGRSCPRRGAGGLCQGRLVAQLGERLRGRTDDRTGHVLCPADAPADCTRRDRTKLLRRRQLSKRHSPHRFYVWGAIVCWRN